MKNVALGILGLIALTGSAVAADMAPRYAKAMPAPVMTYNWTGCYLGGNVGGGWHRVNQNEPRDVFGNVFTPPVDLGTGDGSRVIGGVQIGCDYQFAGNWIFGVQGIFDFGDIRSRNSIPDPRVLALLVPFSQETRTSNLYTSTARLGYLFTLQLLGYAKGGGAFTKTSTDIFATAPVFALSQFGSAYRVGWTVGGGLEYMFTPGWSVFGEYNYMDFGRTETNFAAAPNTLGAPTAVSARLTMQTALVGVNYKLNLGGPIVAKY